MAKDYFQDIVPPETPRHRASAQKSSNEGPGDEEVTHIIPINTNSEPSGRSIRNIAPPQRPRHRPIDEGRVPPPNLGTMRPRRSSSRIFLWGAAAVCVLLLAALLFVAIRPTRVTIQPRTHTLTFADEVFTAEPAASAGGFAYSVETVELEDSEVVPSDGMVYGEDKASGNLTLYNNYQTTPLKLVKNTRFASASGAIFRTPADIVVPAKQGSTPGKIEITVIADQPGEQYNVAPGRFTLPGLRSTADMYAQVYAESTSAFAGGFVGERPGVAAGALESAVAGVRARLETKARDTVRAMPADVIAFPELVQIEYQSLPNTTEAGGGVRIHQRARVQIPVFTVGDFAAGVGSSAIGATDAADVELVPGEIFNATPVGTSTVLGAGPIRFSMSGSVLLVWKVDIPELQTALAGKDKSAFEAIVSGVPAIQEAAARIEPFWRGSFPTDPSDIKIKVEDPKSSE